MKLKAAEVIAGRVEPEDILPDPLDKDMHLAVACSPGVKATESARTMLAKHVSDLSYSSAFRSYTRLRLAIALFDDVVGPS